MAVMVGLGVSFVAFFVGAIPLWSGARFSDSLFPPESAPGFWILFAIFFSAVTGFTQGVAMSGDLENPGRSIPIGVFGSVALSTVVYAAVIVVFAGAVAMPELRNDLGAMRRVSATGWLIDLGVGRVALGLCASRAFAEHFRGTRRVPGVTPVALR